MLPFLDFQILLFSFIRLNSGSVAGNNLAPESGVWGNSLKPVTSLEKLEMGLGSNLDLELRAAVYMI